MRVLFALLPLLVATSVAAQEEGPATPLFRDEEPLAITLSGPISSIARRAERSTEAHPATLQVGGETLAIELSARGNSRRRRENCRFPPLRVEILGNPDETSLFDRQGRIKLVTHCNYGDRYEQHLLREYAAYRLYNLLTPQSFRVRLLRVTYLDDGDRMATNWGFFIEDVGDAARRLGMREVRVREIRPAALDDHATARFMLFQYMIGNTDWGVTAGPVGENCCHNSRLIGETRDSSANLIPLPYDFDNSGLVDAPYAVPNSSLPIRSVRRRYYRGFCSLDSLVIEEAETFRQARFEMESELASIPGLTENSRQTMRRYLEGFFEDIATTSLINRRLLSRCR